MTTEIGIGIILRKQFTMKTELGMRNIFTLTATTRRFQATAQTSLAQANQMIFTMRATIPI